MLTEMSEPASRTDGYEWQWGWALAVAANLPAPLALGTFAVAKSGAFGMFAGVIAFWLAGAAVVARVPRARPALVRGGLFFALSQIVPVAQLMAGATALELFAPDHDSMSEPVAFLVTVTTGGLLLLAALVCRLIGYVCGWLLCALGRFGAGDPNRHPAQPH